MLVVDCAVGKGKESFRGAWRYLVKQQAVGKSFGPVGSLKPVAQDASSEA